jgi:hypothetical protein
MICYKDMTFCWAACDNDKCSRKYTKEVIANAAKWWGSNEAPIAVQDMSTNCGDFIPLKDKAND